MITSGRIEIDAKRWFESLASKYERIDTAVIRELVQNAADAMLRGGEPVAGWIDVIVANGRLEVHDQGAGFDFEGLRALTVVGVSSTAAARARGDGVRRRLGGVVLDSEGEFGVGFYATALVCSEVAIYTRERGSDCGWIWRYRADTLEYRIEAHPAPLPRHGSRVVAVLRDPSSPLANADRVEEMIHEVADLVPIPIRLNGRPTPVNVTVAPWEVRSGEAETRLFLERLGLLPQSEEAILLPVPEPNDVGLSGVLFFAPGVSSPRTAVFVNRWHVESAGDILPPLLRGLGGVLLSTSLNVVENRERLRRDDNFEATMRFMQRWAGSVLEGPTSEDLGALTRLFELGRQRRHFGQALLKLAGRVATELNADPIALARLGPQLPIQLLDGSMASVGLLRNALIGRMLPAYYVDEATVDLEVALHLMADSVPVIDARPSRTPRALVDVLEALGVEGVGVSTRAVATSTPDVSDDRWRALERVLLQHRVFHISSVRFAAGYSRTLLRIDSTVLANHPVFSKLPVTPSPVAILRQSAEQFDESARVGWKRIMDILRRALFGNASSDRDEALPTVEGAPVGDLQADRMVGLLYLQAPAEIFRVLAVPGVTIDLCVQNPQAARLRLLALTDPEAVEALTSIELCRAISELRISWETADTSRLAEIHDTALGTLMARLPTPVDAPVSAGATHTSGGHR